MEILVLVVVIGGGALLWSKLQRTGGPDIGWAGPATVTGEGGHPTAVERGGPRAVARSLGRVESRKLAGSFSFAVGIALSFLIVLLFGVVWADDFDERWENIGLNAPVFAYPLVGMTVIAAHAAVIRERRDGTVELFASCPASASVRTAGHLRTAWVPVVAVMVFVAVFAAASVWHGSAFGSIPVRTAGDVLAAFALGLGGTWLGIAVARWAPWWPAPIVALVLVGAVSLNISGIGEPGFWNPVRQLSTFPRYPDYDPVFAVRPVWWHLAWLLALCAAVAVVAIARDRRDQAVRLAAVTAVVALVVTGVGTSRPLDAREADRVASMVAHPERHQSCIELTGASVCTFAGFEELGRLVADELEPVLTGLPRAGATALVVRQAYDDDIQELDPGVRARLPHGLPGLGAHEVALGFTTDPETFAVARLSAGLWAVGLPSAARPGSSMESIAGEAPGVIALWVAAQGLGPEEARDLASAHPLVNSDGSVHPLAEGMPWPEPCDVGTSPVVWSPQDLEAARALLAVPADKVRRVLAAEWDTLTRRSTTTATLLARFGLPSVGPIQDLGTGSWECGY